MEKYNDIVGKYFDRLFVIEYLGYFIKEGTKAKRHYYKCVCSCDKNTILIVDRYKLLSGHSTSCGCKAIESAKNRNKENNPSKYYIRRVNENYIDDFGIGHIKMSNTENEMLCDTEHLEELLKYYWNEKNGYARSTRDRKRVYAHRLIMGMGDYDINQQIDHINGDTLDNRKQNLRIVTSRQNGLNSSIRKDNTSGVTGVCWDKRCEKWIARVFENGRIITLGYYSEFDEAVAARKNGEDMYYGEYCRNNSRNKQQSVDTEDNNKNVQPICLTIIEQCFNA